MGITRILRVESELILRRCNVVYLFIAAVIFVGLAAGALLNNKV